MHITHHNNIGIFQICGNMLPIVLLLNSTLSDPYNIGICVISHVCPAGQPFAIWF